MRTVDDLRPGVPFPVHAVVFSFARSGGPGGQNVNKVETKVYARLPLEALRGLADEDLLRLRARLASRLDATGALLVHSQTTRSRERNMEECLRHLRELVLEGLRRPRKRRPTKPTRSSKERRREAKKVRSGVKKMRGPVRDA